MLVILDKHTIFVEMGNSQSGSISEDKKKNYGLNQNGKKSNKKRVEEQNDLWIPTPTTTSVFSELDKHSYAAEILEDSLNPIKEENEDIPVEEKKYTTVKYQNGSIVKEKDIDFKIKPDTEFTQVETSRRHFDRQMNHHIHRSDTNISKSMEVLTYGINMDDTGDKFTGVRYSATREGNTHYKSNPAINTIPFVTLEKPSPQRSSSMRMKMEAGPWQYQKPTYGQLPQDIRERNKVARRSSWTPSTSRFKKIFLLNKPESIPNSRPVWHRSLSHATGEKCYQKTADGQVIAMSPESTLRTSQWVAQHSKNK